MASPNGLASRPVMRFSVVPKWVPFEIERPNPEHEADPSAPETIIVTLRAWDKNLPHPATIDIAVEASHDVYRETLYDLEQQQSENPGLVSSAAREQAANTMISERLCIVIEGNGTDPGLQSEEADILVSASGPWEDILVALGWWRRAEAQPVAPSDGQEDADDPEAKAGEAPATTTDESSLASLQPTASTVGET